MATFSEDSKEVARDFFKRFDYNDDGTLQKKQLVDALHAFGFDLDREGIAFLKQHFDIDGDGEVQISELVDNMDVLIKYSVDGEKLQEAFKRLDLNGDGYISSRELRQILTTPGPNQMSTQQAQSVVDEMLEKYDANNDKRFSYIEFVRMIIGKEGEGGMPFQVDNLVYNPK